MLERLYYSESDTIDELLTIYKDDQEFVRFGKHITAAVLMKHENRDRLFPMQPHCWYRPFLKQLLRNPTAIKDRNVSFLTFNYDRSLDHYLERALVNNAHSPEHVHRLLGKDNFIHVHGQLGHLPWQGNSVREYGHEIDGEKIEIAARGLFLPHEDLGDVDSRILGVVEKADIVCVCGFGFHEANVVRSQLNALVGRKVLLFTLRHMPPAKYDAIKAKYRPSNVLDNISTCITQAFEVANQ